MDLELTARCNLNCRHCYINLPPGAKRARKNELSFQEIKKIVDDAVELGALWCLITGGEPFLREDFTDIYLYIKKKGLLVFLFTNATLINEKHIKLFEKYPPRELEVTVYGATKKTYEQVTRIPGSYMAFQRGLSFLRKSSLNFGLKAMALRSNLREFDKIVEFSRNISRRPFRFDPFLHLRYDKDPQRNKWIAAERLSAQEIINLEQGDVQRSLELKRECHNLVISKRSINNEAYLFYCGAGLQSCSISYDGRFRLCASLWHPECLYDLRAGSLREAWEKFVPKIRSLKSRRKEYRERCGNCRLVNLCLWCPAHSYLETGEMDRPVEYFCEVAHARERMLIK